MKRDQNQGIMNVIKQLKELSKKAMMGDIDALDEEAAQHQSEGNAGLGESMTELTKGLNKAGSMSEEDPYCEDGDDDDEIMIVKSKKKSDKSY